MASNASLELIAAAFSAMIGVEVVTPQRAAQLGLPKLSIHQIFRATYIMRPIENTSELSLVHELSSISPTISPLWK